MFLKTLPPFSFCTQSPEQNPFRCDTLHTLTTLPVYVQSVRSVGIMCLLLNKRFHLKCQGKNFLSAKVLHLDIREFSVKLLTLMPVWGCSGISLKPYSLALIKPNKMLTDIEEMSIGEHCEACLSQEHFCLSLICYLSFWFIVIFLIK